MPDNPSDQQYHQFNIAATAVESYQQILTDVEQLLTTARHTAARSLNTIMTTTYWEIGRRIIEGEQDGQARAVYGGKLLERLSADLTRRFGRGFSIVNLRSMRRFYLDWPPSTIQQTVSDELSDKFPLADSLAYKAPTFTLPWSHYVLLMTVTNREARIFYETEATRGGWTVRQLDRQINAMFYERTMLSRNKAALITHGGHAVTTDHITPEEEIKDPYVLEFLDLKDEYSESDLEQALIEKLSTFLLELGDDFAFIGQQRRLRIGDEWYRVDLLFFHRRLRCLIVIDLKLGKFTHADAGQMHLYLNYAHEHWMREGENPPVGLILCARKDHAVAHYALEGLPNKVLAAEYRMTLPDEQILAEELTRTRRKLEHKHP